MQRLTRMGVRQKMFLDASRISERRVRETISKAQGSQLLAANALARAQEGGNPHQADARTPATKLKKMRLRWVSGEKP